MNRTPVKSSYLAAIGYDAAAQTLDVEFKTGRVYRYQEFTPEMWAELQASESVGRYINATCRTLTFTRVDEPPKEETNGTLPGMHDDRKP